jgi:hypothetical protein
MIKKILKYFSLVVLGLLLLLFLFLFSPGLWNRWVVYPRLEKQINAFQSLRKEPESLTQLNVYRGALHAHSFWSHDSEGTLSDIIPAAKKVGIDFIFLTDHAHGNSDTIPRGYKGYYDGVLIEPGTERQGFCAWPLRPAVTDWSLDKDTIAKNMVSNGGMIFYAHSEEDHNWNNPYYQGMEIYSIHTDIKDESLLPIITNFIASGAKNRAWSMRESFDEQTSILAHWDSLNQWRPIVGFSAVDAHENQNFRARYLKDGRVEWVGPNAKPIDTVKATLWNRWLFHDPDENGWIFKFMIDTYEASFNNVTNYVLADTLSVPSISNHLKKGHLFIAFKSLGDAKGFMFCAKNDEGKVSGILGDSVQLNQVKSLLAVSPLPGQFRLIHNGKVIDTSSDEQYEYHWSEQIKKGVYRIEIHIKLNDKFFPWVYSNPIHVF